MKLYTEEQIKDAYYKGFYTDYRAIPYSDSLGLRQTPDSYCREFVKSLTPIELPSDEEIWEKIEDSAYSLEYDTGFAQGVKWVIEQIKQQDNGN